MSRTRNSILFYIAISPLGYILLTHLHHVVLPFNLIQKTTCQNPSHLLETYSAPGLHDIMDRIVCVLVKFCSQAINDPLCFPVTATLVGLATTAYAVMSVEKVRFKSNACLTPFMILMGNVIGTGLIAPMAWLPWYGWSLYKHQKKSKKNQVAINADSKSINKKQNLREKIIDYHSQQHSMPHVAPHRTFGIALAALFGQFLPVALLVSHGPSLTQRNILAAFQYFPIAYGLFEWIVPFFVNHLDCKTKRGATDSVRLMYAGVASINTFLWYWVWIKWLQTTSAPESMVKQWIELFFSLGSSGTNPVAYMLMWDIAALLTTFTYWAWLEDGKEGVKTVLYNSVLFGPGAGLALYAMKRESRI
ncbi:hypothetical protein [Parasitella parasitica]|uniref:Uncharacterized protein n=1 Tax=Parasitella parasitica TaxID=35722 RepID=A0A0B7NC59_9FUNG|nr:hypothetical protein [Parasitella parasitica]